jgi:hypothetical protein
LSVRSTSTVPGSRMGPPGTVTNPLPHLTRGRAAYGPGGPGWPDPGGRCRRWRNANHDTDNPTSRRPRRTRRYNQGGCRRRTRRGPAPCCPCRRRCFRAVDVEHLSVARGQFRRRGLTAAPLAGQAAEPTATFSCRNRRALATGVTRLLLKTGAHGFARPSRVTVRIMAAAVPLLRPHLRRPVITKTCRAAGDMRPTYGRPSSGIPSWVDQR